MNIKCVIFDCDGLMFDTEKLSRKHWHLIMDKYGVDIPDDFFDKITGAGKAYANEVINSNPKIAEHIDEIRSNRLPFFQEYVAQGNSLAKKGLFELNEYLRNTDIKVCVASSSHIDYVNWLLSTLNPQMTYTTVLGGNMVEKGKPFPDIFLKAAEIAGIEPENCLVLEDSKNGTLAAKAAGMHRCFIEDLVKPDSEMQSAIEFQLNDLSEVINLLKRK